MEKTRKKVMVDYYDDLYLKETPFREEWEGLIGINYKVPKEVSYFVKFFRHLKSPTVLEVGAGDGTSYREAVKQMKFSKYVPTEISLSAVEKLKTKGLQAVQMDATRLTFPDNSFDIVCTYNTMHHVDDPAKMAQEMLRVSKRFVFLSEANGVCLIRKLLELTPRNRRANEHSYSPKKYLSFFGKAHVKGTTVVPFGFVFAFTPSFLIPAAISLSEFFEKVPLLRWQGSSLTIIVEKQH